MYVCVVPARVHACVCTSAQLFFYVGTHCLGGIKLIVCVHVLNVFLTSLKKYLFMNMQSVVMH